MRSVVICLDPQEGDLVYMKLEKTERPSLPQNSLTPPTHVSATTHAGGNGQRGDAGGGGEVTFSMVASSDDPCVRRWDEAQAPRRQRATISRTKSLLR